jgi:hypothetical protein
MDAFDETRGMVWAIARRRGSRARREDLLARMMVLQL